MTPPVYHTCDQSSHINWRIANENLWLSAESKGETGMEPYLIKL
jgi:hypothetical protein